MSIQTTGQRGFSLTELMIGLALTSLIILGIAEVYIGSKASFRYGTAQGRAQENLRYASHALRRQINHAGMRRNRIDMPIEVFDGSSVLGTELWAVSAINDSDGTETIHGKNIAGIPDGSDVLILRYESDGSSPSNCRGTAPTPTAAPLTSSKSINVEIYYVDDQVSSNSNELTCSTFGIQRGADNSANALNVVTSGLIDDITDMQIRLGEDTDGDREPNRFVEPGTPTLDMKDVVAVEFTLTLSGAPPIGYLDLVEDPNSATTVTEITRTTTEVVSLRNMQR